MATFSSAKIPLWLAILININIVVGGAFFIGAPTIGKVAGIYAPLAWLVGAAILIPISIVFAHLASKFPQAGGVYVYSREAFGRFWGFLTGWAYFVGNSAGNAVFVHAFSSAALALPSISTFAGQIGLSNLGLSLIVTLACVLLSTGGENLLENAQLLITWLKIMPFLIVFLGVVLFSGHANLVTLPIAAGWFSGVLPSILFAYVGIEASSSIAHTIQDGSKNVARATYISLFLVALIYSLTHLGLILSMGAGSTEEGAFTRLAWLVGAKLGLFFPTLFYNFVLASVAISYIGSAYSMFHTDSWLLHAMSTDFTGPIKNIFSVLNARGRPKNCIFIQGLLVAVLLIFGKNQGWMLNASILGAILAFIATTFAYIKIFKFRRLFPTAAFSLVATALISLIAVKEFLADGFLAAIPMMIVLFAGFFVYMIDMVSSSVV